MSVELTAAWWGSEDTVLGVDVLDHLKALKASGLESVHINDNFTCDPQNGVAKTLFVTYTVNGETKKLQVRDFDTLRFADLQ
jgi:hypothetical protein